MADFDLTRTTAKLDASQVISGVFDVARIPAPGAHSHVISDVTALQTALDAKVNNTGNETIAGTKTFSGTVIINGSIQVPVGTLLTHPVRRDDSRLTDSRNPTTHSHPISEVTSLQAALDAKSDTSHTHSYAATSHSHATTDITSGRLTAARLPLVTGDILSGSGSGAIATDADQGNIRNYTATGNVTINVPSNGSDGQVIQYAVLASGGARTITFTAALNELTGISAGPTSIPSGKLCRFSLRRSALTSTWIVEAFGITQ